MDNEDEESQSEVQWFQELGNFIVLNFYGIQMQKFICSILESMVC